MSRRFGEIGNGLTDDRDPGRLGHLEVVLEKGDEPGYAQALKLQDAILADEVEIRVPTLWRYEVGNVL